MMVRHGAALAVLVALALAARSEALFLLRRSLKPTPAKELVANFYESVPGNDAESYTTPSLSLSAGGAFVMGMVDSQSGQVWVGRSTNVGASWQYPAATAGLLGVASGPVQLSVVRCAPSASVCVALWPSASGAGLVDTALSLDGGATAWDVASLGQLPLPGIRTVTGLDAACWAPRAGEAEGAAVGAFPDASGAASLALLRADARAKGKWQLVALRAGAGAGAAAMGCTQDGQRCAVVAAASGAGGDAQVLVASSGDGARTWAFSAEPLAGSEATAAAVAAARAAHGAGRVAVPALDVACADANRCVAVAEVSVDGGASRVEYAFSDTGASSFRALAQLSTDAAASATPQRRPSVQCAPSTVCVVAWTNAVTNARAQPALRFSTDAGLTFEAAQTLATLPTTGSFGAASVACADAGCVVAKECFAFTGQAKQGAKSLCVSNNARAPPGKGTLAPTQPPTVPTAPPAANPAGPINVAAGQAVTTTGSNSSTIAIIVGAGVLLALALFWAGCCRSSPSAAVATNSASRKLVPPSPAAELLRQERKGSAQALSPQVPGGAALPEPARLRDTERTADVSFRFVFPRMSNLIVHKVSNRFQSNRTLF